MTDLINLPQLEVEIKFYLGQTAQNIIEVGKRLIQAKSLVQHGQWQTWLQNNFQLTDRTARRFMQISERFSKTDDVDRFQPSQLAELLALPDAEETERFIAEKAAEGKAVADALQGICYLDDKQIVEGTFRKFTSNPRLEIELEEE